MKSFKNGETVLVIEDRQRYSARYVCFDKSENKHVCAYDLFSDLSQDTGLYHVSDDDIKPAPVEPEYTLVESIFDLSKGEQYFVKDHNDHYVPLEDPSMENVVYGELDSSNLYRIKPAIPGFDKTMERMREDVISNTKFRTKPEQKSYGFTYTKKEMVVPVYDRTVTEPEQYPNEFTYTGDVEALAKWMGHTEGDVEWWIHNNVTQFQNGCKIVRIITPGNQDIFKVKS